MYLDSEEGYLINEDQDPEVTKMQIHANPNPQTQKTDVLTYFLHITILHYYIFVFSFHFFWLRKRKGLNDKVFKRRRLAKPLVLFLSSHYYKDYRY